MMCCSPRLGSEQGGRAGVEIGDGSMRARSGLLSSTGQRVESLRSQWRGLPGRSGTDGGQLPRRRTHPRRRPGSIPACASVKAEVRGLGVDPGHETELLRRIWWAVVRQDGRSTAEQEARCGGAEWGSSARIWGGYEVGDEGAERSRGGLKRNAGDLGRGRARGKAGDLGPDVALPVRGEEEGLERGSADGWGQRAR
jgi:hypothetical protein